MRTIKHSELLPFLHGLNPNGEVSAEEIEDIIVDYNGQYMYAARITYDGYYCRWKCESIQYEDGNPDAGTGRRIVPYSDPRTVRTNSSSPSSLWSTLPTSEAAVPESTEEERRGFTDLVRQYLSFGRAD